MMEERNQVQWQQQPNQNSSLWKKDSSLWTKGNCVKVSLKLRTGSHGKATEEATSDQNQVLEEYKFTMLYLVVLSNFSVASAHLQLVDFQSCTWVADI